MEITETYPTLEDAKAGIKAHEKQGHQVLHENHYYREDMVAMKAELGEDAAQERPITVLDHAELVIETTPDTKPLPMVDSKAEFAAASTVALKVDVLARHLGLK